MHSSHMPFFIKNDSGFVDEDTNEVIEKEFYADAQVDIADGVLLCSTADPSNPYAIKAATFPDGVFHVIEYRISVFKSDAL